MEENLSKISAAMLTIQIRTEP